MMKRILDVCCGSKMFYFNKNNPLVHFNDLRKLEEPLCDGRMLKIHPDTQWDFRHLPVPDNTYDMVVFDPPHLVKVGDNSWLAKKYGKLPCPKYQNAFFYVILFLSKNMEVAICME